MNCLSFDVGGTTIKYGVINNSYEVIRKDKISTPPHVQLTRYLISTDKQRNTDCEQPVMCKMGVFGSHVAM